MHYQHERNYGCRISDAWTFRGLKTAVLENELLRVVVLLDKGSDIYELVHKPTDVNVLWRSPWGVRDPRRFVPTTGSMLWMDVYEGGWQTVLPGGGFPSEYRGADFGLHAEVNTMPWDSVITEDTPERVSLKCWVRAARTPFFFERELTLTRGSGVLQTRSALTNESDEAVHCVWGEHIALGAPLLSSDSVIDLPGGRAFNHPEFHENNRLRGGHEAEWPSTEGKNGEPVDLSKVPPGSIAAYDLSYVTDMPAGWYALTNPGLGLGFGVTYPTDVFPFLWYWQNFGGGTGYPFWGRGYNVGLEPFTSYTNGGLANAVENGTALLVEPGQRVEAWTNAVVYTGSERVSRIEPDGTVVREG